MRKNTIIIAVLVAICVFGIAYAIIIPQQPRANALNVNDVGADPAAYVGEITITGIMAGVSDRDKQIFGIMDMKELQCTSTTCKKVMIPVKYDGQTPAIGDEVHVTGSFIQTGQGYYFMAKNVQVVQNHQLGG